MARTQILELPSKQLTTMKAVQVADLTEAPNQILDQDRQADLEQILVSLISTMQVLDLLADLDSVLQGVSVKDHSRAFLKVMSQTLGTLHLVNAPCSLTWNQTLATGLHVGHWEDLTFNPILATVPLGDVQVDRTLSQTLVMDCPEDPKGQALDQTSEAAHRDDPREYQRSSLTLVAALPEGHRVAPRSGQTLVEVRREEGRLAGQRSSRTSGTAPLDVAHKGRPTLSLALLLTASTSSRTIRTRRKSRREGIPTTRAMRGHRTRTTRKRSRSFEVRRIS